MTKPLSDAEITRYARQLILPDIGDDGQDALKDAKLLILGAGGLGVPALSYAAAAGFGTITVIDDDVIELTNLNRQILYHEDDCGVGKAKIAAEKAALQNPHITIKALEKRYDNSCHNLVADYDVIIDASDNAETRLLVNQHCLAAHKPLIFVSAIRFEGQLSVFAPHLSDDNTSPCYHCLFPHHPDAAQAPNCATIGIMGAVTGIMGAMAALEAIKLVTQSGQPAINKLLLFDGLTLQSDFIVTKKDKNCHICS